MSKGVGPWRRGFKLKVIPETKVGKGAGSDGV